MTLKNPPNVFFYKILRKNTSFQFKIATGYTYIHTYSWNPKK